MDGRNRVVNVAEAVRDLTLPRPRFGTPGYAHVDICTVYVAIAIVGRERIEAQTRGYQGSDSPLE
jgi:hypothetical protein